MKRKNGVSTDFAEIPNIFFIQNMGCVGRSWKDLLVLTNLLHDDNTESNVRPLAIQVPNQVEREHFLSFALLQSQKYPKSRVAISKKEIIEIFDFDENSDFHKQIIPFPSPPQNPISLAHLHFIEERNSLLFSKNTNFGFHGKTQLSCLDLSNFRPREVLGVRDIYDFSTIVYQKKRFLATLHNVKTSRFVMGHYGEDHYYKRHIKVWDFDSGELFRQIDMSESLEMADGLAIGFVWTTFKTSGSFLVTMDNYCDDPNIQILDMESGEVTEDCKIGIQGIDGTETIRWLDKSKRDVLVCDFNGRHLTFVQCDLPFEKEKERIVKLDVDENERFQHFVEFCNPFSIVNQNTFLISSVCKCF